MCRISHNPKCKSGFLCVQLRKLFSFAIFDYLAFLFLYQAIWNFYGGCISGPTGTGKTETIKVCIAFLFADLFLIWKRAVKNHAVSYPLTSGQTT